MVRAVDEIAIALLWVEFDIGNVEAPRITVKARVVVSLRPAEALYDSDAQSSLLFSSRQFNPPKENDHGKPKTRLRCLHHH